MVNIKFKCKEIVGTSPRSLCEVADTHAHAKAISTLILGVTTANVERGIINSRKLI
jgi:flavin-binding protein dodecin